MMELVFRDFELDHRPIPTSPSGRAWFVLDGKCFPSENWFDFPLSILGSAFDAYLELASGADEAVSYVFDGSFHLRYRRSSSGFDAAVEVGAYSEEGDHGENLVAEEVASLSELRKALSDSARIMSRALSSAEDSEGVNMRIVTKILKRLEEDSL